MYLKLTNDHTASFYNNESMNDESKECFKFNPYHYPDLDITYCFETDMKDDLRSFFKRFGVEMDADVSKLQFYLYQDGEIGQCS